MRSGDKIAVNPIQWFSCGPSRWNLTEDRVAKALDGIADAGFKAMQADIPDGMSAAAYASLLSVRDVRPAPSYWGIVLDSRDDASDGLSEQAKRRAAAQTELGVTDMVISDEMNPARVAYPGVGADFDQHRLDRVIERVAEVASVLRTEGITPCFHPHVGTWIETDREVRALLDAVDPGTLEFAPDIAHLAWAGADPALLIADFASRVGLIHLKDAHLPAIERVRHDRLDYDTAVYVEHVFTEPGRGDMNLEAILAAVPNDYDGWWVAEVDVPDLLTKEASVATCAAWMSDHIAGGNFRSNSSPPPRSECQ
jgi:inosose dehydratase